MTQDGHLSHACSALINANPTKGFNLCSPGAVKPQPQHILLNLGAEEGGGGGGAITAALDGSSRAHSAGDVVVSLILVCVVFFVTFMASFFWRKYRNIHCMRNTLAYEYSQLSQCERDPGDLTDIADELGISINTSTDEEELEASPSEDLDRRSARPATIRVTASYITTLANLTNSGKDEEASIINNNTIDDLSPVEDLAPVIQPDAPEGMPRPPAPVAGRLTSPQPLLGQPLPVLPLMPPPLQPENAAKDKPQPRQALFTDSDEELLQ
ncbi:ATPase synthesis protein 25, mitochondrial [Frankliniella fusca]|uniref:ATPase synthesis protein 25, mitochondrial n=1 Tax=Frankliniella fusca TaxID=407009 RepID=A0AAE1H2C7_9NEOP|nr:ATPase synthesis protein 25, mitochondrial [Frankliniella fusca]